jgi:glycosyltransferase involved in cell wall biosynthesis
VRILFVVMGDSIHAARWIGQLADQDWDVHVFPHSEHEAIHPEFRNVTFHKLVKHKTASQQRIRQTGLPWPISRGHTRARSTLLRFPAMQQSQRLARTVSKLKPDLIHILEMQRSGYLALDMLDNFGGGLRLPPIIYSCWGNDIYHFGKRPDHRQRIKKFLARCDYFLADCYRDIGLARQFGFKGQVLGVFPGGGGFDLDQVAKFRNEEPPSQRRIITLKGYDGGDWGGRASVALEAMRLCARELRQFEIVIYSANGSLKQRAEEIGAASGLSFNFKSQLKHSEMLSLFASARVAIGVSVADGTPNTMLEAMLMGAFPIQSDTVSTGEWIKHGRNGLLVPPEDPAAVAALIRHALADDQLVDHAQRINARITRRIGRSVVQPQVIGMYKSIEFGKPATEVPPEFADEGRAACAS